MSFLEEYTAADEKLDAEQKAYDRKVSEADYEVIQAVDAKANYIKSINEEIKLTRDSQNRRISSFSGAYLYPTYVSYRGTKITFDEAVSGYISVNGNVTTSVSTKTSSGISIPGTIGATAIASTFGAAVIMGKTRTETSVKTVDNRHAFMVICSPTKQFSVEFYPDSEAKARGFIDEVINVAGRSAQSAQAAEGKILALQKKQSNTSSFDERIEQAKKNQIEAHKDTRALDEAKQRVRDLRKSATPTELNQIEEYHSKKQIHEATRVIVILLICILIIGVVGYLLTH